MIANRYVKSGFFTYPYKKMNLLEQMIKENNLPDEKKFSFLITYIRLYQGLESQQMNDIIEQYFQNHMKELREKAEKKVNKNVGKGTKLSATELANLMPPDSDLITKDEEMELREKWIPHAKRDFELSGESKKVCSSLLISNIIVGYIGRFVTRNGKKQSPIILSRAIPYKIRSKKNYSFITKQRSKITTRNHSRM
jgi:hypothetical protein